MMTLSTAAAVTIQLHQKTAMIRLSAVKEMILLSAETVMILMFGISVTVLTRLVITAEPTESNLVPALRLMI